MRGGEGRLPLPRGCTETPQTPCSLERKTEWRRTLQAQTLAPHNFPIVLLSTWSRPQVCSARREIVACLAVGVCVRQTPAGAGSSQLTSCMELG